MIILILVSVFDELFQVFLPHCLENIKDIFINSLKWLLEFGALNTFHKPSKIENNKKNLVRDLTFVSQPAKN